VKVAPAGTPPSRYALARLIAGHICLHACMAGMRMAAPLLALREGFSALAVGFLLALFALTQVFLALPAGRYVDRHGLKRPVGLCVLAASVGAALALAFPVFPALCLSALMTGGATGVAAILCSVMWGGPRKMPMSSKKCSAGCRSGRPCPILSGLWRPGC
jgi:MFS family permease